MRRRETGCPLTGEPPYGCEDCAYFGVDPTRCELYEDDAATVRALREMLEESEEELEAARREIRRLHEQAQGADRARIALRAMLDDGRRMVRIHGLAQMLGLDVSSRGVR